MARETCAFAKSESNGVLGRTAGGTTGLLGVTTGVLGVTAGLLRVTTGLLGVTGNRWSWSNYILELANTNYFPLWLENIGKAPKSTRLFGLVKLNAALPPLVSTSVTLPLATFAPWLVTPIL